MNMKMIPKNITDLLALSAIIVSKFSLLFCKEGLDYYDVCGHLGTCGNYDEPGVLRCHCDNLCTFYGDCCFGFSRNGSNTGSDELLLEHKQYSKKISCEQVRGNSYQFWLADRGPFCKRISRRDPILNSVPVYDTVSQLTFKNIYCSDSYTGKISTIRFWKVKVSRCLENLLDFIQNGEGGYASLYEVYKKIFYDPTCIVTIIPPENSNPRICFASDSECVDTKYHNACFAFQNPVIRLASKSYPTATTYKLYRNYVCQKCDPDHFPGDKLECFLENTETAKFKEETSVILNDIRYEVLESKFVTPFPCAVYGEVRTKGICKIMNCSEGLVQNYLDCVYPVKSVSGIKLDQRIRLLNLSSFHGSLPVDDIKAIFDKDLRQSFKDFTTQITVSARRGLFGKLMLPCVIYVLDLHIFLRDYLDFERSMNISDEIRGLFQNQTTTIERLLNFTSISYSDGNEYDTECLSSVSDIFCGFTWNMLIISLVASFQVVC